MPPIALAQQMDDGSEAYRILEREKAIAEDTAALLKEFKSLDLQAYAEGIQHYANARGEFNGLIEQIKQNLIAGEAFERSNTFDRKLQIAVGKRMAFTHHVEEKIIQFLGKQQKKGLPLLGALLDTPAELISTISAAAKTLWQEYKKAQDARRKEMLDQLDGMKWVSFQQAGN